MQGSTLTSSRRAEPEQPRPQPFLFLVLDGQRPLAPSARLALAQTKTVTLGRGEGRPARVGSQLGIPIPDPYVSSTHAVLTRGEAGWTIEDRSKNGSFVNGRPLRKQAALADGDLIEVASTFFIFRDGLEATAEDAGDLHASELHPRAAGLGTLLPPLQRSFEQLERIARSPVAVLLRGETGSGKEVLARALHALSRRRGVFVAVNCGALPDNLVESELFGARKGAFTGATEDRPGLVRSADQGTLLLDEIGDLPLASQAALLRVLQEREVTPVGGTKPIAVDLRVVAASHHDLEKLVAKGTFRADLEARLAGFRLDVPPLRERREDLGILVAALLRRAFPDAASELVIDAMAARALLTYSWPKNIRELEQAVTSAVALGGTKVGLEHLPAVLRAPPAPDAPLAPDATDPGLRQELTEKLTSLSGNISAVARAMGKPRKQIQRWLQRYALDAAAFRK